MPEQELRGSGGSRLGSQGGGGGGGGGTVVRMHEHPWETNPDELKCSVWKIRSKVWALGGMKASA